MKKILSALVLFVFLFTVSLFVGSSTVGKLSWDTPNERVNGTSMSADEISHYTLRCESDDIQVTYEIPNVDLDGESKYDLNITEVFSEYGDYNCHLTVTDTFGLTSAPSNEIVISKERSNPKAITNFSINF